MNLLIPKPNQYFKMSTTIGRIENVMNINEEGISDWISITELEKKTDSKLTGNGGIYFNPGRGLGKRYIVEKKYKAVGGVIKTGIKAKGKILAIRTMGFEERKHQGFPSIEDQKILRRMKCAWCGQSGVEIDHRDPRQDYIGVLSIDSFQPLCRHCNHVKRERCIKCMKTNVRYNVTNLGFLIPYTEGDENFVEKGLRCEGCFLHGPVEFRKIYAKKVYEL